MCLQCGNRLALDYKRPASWKVAGTIIGVIVLLAGGALAIALANITSDANNDSKAPAQSVAAGQPPAAPAETGTAPTDSGVSPAPPTDTPAPAETTPEPAPTEPAPAAGGSWPAGKDAHTVILASAGSRQEAETKQKEASAKGITAGILESKDFKSLRPGYWVVFDGQFGSLEEATKRAEEDRGKGFTDAYPRFVDSN
jgi:hypothetical protein